MENNNVKLTFGEDDGRCNTIEFSNEEEFFETLGILCRDDGSVEIKEKKGDAVGFHKDGEIMGGSDPTAALLSGGESVASANFHLVCQPTIYYTKVLYDEFKDPYKENKFSCVKYIRYLMSDYDFELYAKPRDGAIAIASVRIPTADKMRDIIKSKNFKNFYEYLYFFEKGLNAPKRT